MQKEESQEDGADGDIDVDGGNPAVLSGELMSLRSMTFDKILPALSPFHTRGTNSLGSFRVLSVVAFPVPFDRHYCTFSLPSAEIADRLK